MNRTLADAAKALPPSERLNLIDELWESLIADKFEPEVTPAQAAELERRLADHRANPDNVISWEELHADLEKKYRPAQ